MMLYRPLSILNSDRTFIGLTFCYRRRFFEWLLLFPREILSLGLMMMTTTKTAVVAVVVVSVSVSVIVIVMLAMAVVMMVTSKKPFFQNVKQRQRLLLLPLRHLVMMEIHLNLHKRLFDLPHFIDRPDSLYVKGSIWTNHLILNLQKENYRIDSSYVQKPID